MRKRGYRPLGIRIRRLANSVERRLKQMTGARKRKYTRISFIE